MEKLNHLPIFILAGGKGTRLASVVSDVPKPLAPVNGKPFLQYLLENYTNQGFRKFYFLLHFKADQIIQCVESLKESILQDSEVFFSIEPSLLGTGGAVAYTLDTLKFVGEFLIVNADTWVDEKSMAALERSKAPAIGVIHIADVSRYGKVTIQDNTILAFEEKKENAGQGWINAGIYKLDSRNFDGKHGEFSMEKEIFPDLAKANKLQAVALDTEFIDIGIPEDYVRFQKWIGSDRKEKL